jgi:BASS family bile acid:Na+ symporter
MPQNHVDALQLNFNAEALAGLNIALAVVMFGIALAIKPQDFKLLLLQPRAAVLGIVAQFIALPALSFLLVLLLQPSASIALGMILVAACPGGNISNYMTHLAGGNTALSVCLTAFASVAAIFLTPFNLQFWGSLYPPTQALLTTIQLDVWDVFRIIFLILGLPLVAGMLTNRYLPKMAHRLSKLLKPLSFFVFVALVFLALANNFQQFLEYVHYVVFLVFLHNLIALSTGFGLGKLFRLSLQDCKTLAIETGIQNSGLGLLLIFSFFNGLGGMALVAAWWGIWHIVAGLSLSTYWNRKTKSLAKPA